MGFSVIGGGLGVDELVELLEQNNFSLDDDEIVIGDETISLTIDLNSGDVTIGNSSSGIILHSSPGQTKAGVTVNQSGWVEIYGNQIHFSEL